MDCYVALGSNLGDRSANLRAGIDGLGRQGLEPVALSSVWETEPVDTGPGPWFWNMVVRVCSDRGPLELLDALLDVERRAGRIRGRPNGPRTLDLDLLLIGELCWSDSSLTLPHPRMWGRSFVLEPLAEIAPDLRNPLSGRTVEEERRDLEGSHAVRRIGRLARHASASL